MFNDSFYGVTEIDSDAAQTITGGGIVSGILIAVTVPIAINAYNNWEEFKAEVAEHYYD